MVKQKAVTTNTQLLQYAQSQRPRSCRGEETNAKDYTRSFKVDSSHMTVSSEVKSFEFAQVDLRSTWGHFSFKWGHIFLDRSDSQVYSWTKLHMMCSSASSSASIDPAMGYHLMWNCDGIRLWTSFWSSSGCLFKLIDIGAYLSSAIVVFGWSNARLYHCMEEEIELKRFDVKFL